MTWKTRFTRIYDIRPSVRPPLIRPSVSAFYPNPAATAVQLSVRKWYENLPEQSKQLWKCGKVKRVKYKDVVKIIPSLFGYL